MYRRGRHHMGWISTNSSTLGRSLSQFVLWSVPNDPTEGQNIILNTTERSKLTEDVTLTIEIENLRLDGARLIAYQRFVTDGLAQRKHSEECLLNWRAKAIRAG